MQLKPQDFLVALKLVAWADQRWTYASLAHALGLSASEAHACVKRGLHAGLLLDNRVFALPEAPPGVREAGGIYVLPKRSRRAPPGALADAAAGNPARVHPRNLAEFALHGAKYAFSADTLGPTVGVPTSHSAPAFAGVFAPGSDDYVWPHPQGSVRGTGLAPLHPSVPYAAMQDARLYEMLALFDALRIGRARERGMAAQRLPALIHPSDADKSGASTHG
jgi:hypothetical protein